LKDIVKLIIIRVIPN